MVVMQLAYKEATNIGNVDKNRMIDDVSFRAFQNVYKSGVATPARSRNILPAY